MLDVIKSYLVGLGFQVNQAEFAKAQGAVNELGRTVQTATSGMTKNFTVAAAGVTAALTAINVATAGLMAQVAGADMQYQKFALRLWTTKENAKELKTVLDAMGESMEDVAWIPELRQQYFQLVRQGRQMATPADAPEQLKYIRSILFEFRRMKLEAQYAMEWVAYYLGKYLSGPLAGIKRQLTEFNDKLTATLPGWTKRIAELLATFMNFGIAAGRFIKDLYQGFRRVFDLLPEGAKKAVTAIAVIGTAFAASPLGATIAAIVILLEDFYGYIDGRKSSKTLAPLWDKLIAVLKAVDRYLDDLKPVVEDFWSTVTQWTEAAISTLKRYWNAFRESKFAQALLEVFLSLWKALKTVVGILIDFFKNLWDELADLFGFLLDDGTLEMVVDLFTTLLQTVSSLILGIANLTKEIWRFWKEAAGTQAARSMWDWFKGTVSFVLKLVSSLGKGFLGLFDMIGLGLQGKYGAAAERGRRILRDMQRDIDFTFGDADSPSGGKVGDQRMMALAQRVSRQTGLPAQWIYGQWYHESQGFTSQLARENFNFGGLTQEEYNGAENKQPDGNNYYIKFSSPEAYADYFAEYIQRYGPNGIYNAETVEEYAHALKRGGYYTDSEARYAAGIRQGMNTYAPESGYAATSRPTVRRMSTAGMNHPITASPFSQAVDTARNNLTDYRRNAYFAPPAGGYAGGSVVTVGDIYVTQPNATPAEIQQSVAAGVQQGIKRNTAIQIREMRPVII